MTQQATMTLSDLLAYRNSLVRTGKCFALGRMRTIAIGPVKGFVPPPNDPYINGWGDQPQTKARGRMMDLSGQPMPIAQGEDRSLLLCCATLIRSDGYVGLPDLVDPLWRAPNYTPEEVQNPDCDAVCRKEWDVVDGKSVPHKHVRLRAEKDRPRMIPQRLEDRTNQYLDGTNYMVFQPVLRVTYQPESLKGDKHGFQPAEWKIDFQPEPNGTQCAFLVDSKTGECHFYGGIPIYGGDTKG